MNDSEIYNLVIKLFEDYLKGTVKPKEFIERYHSIIIGEKFPWDSENPNIQTLDDFHDELSLFVENPEWRKEHTSYYGEPELRKKVENFLEFLKRIRGS